VVKIFGRLPGCQGRQVKAQVHRQEHPPGGGTQLGRIRQSKSQEVTGDRIEMSLLKALQGGKRDYKVVSISKTGEAVGLRNRVF